tara:strand:- start:374 stop:631 length:258 start_codon:yes stop_codon:yes gene_type:complete
MITVLKTYEDNAHYFHYNEGQLEIRVYIKLGLGEYSNCSISTNKQRDRMSLPKVFHGEDCLLKALNSYKNITYKKALRAIISEMV